MKRPAGFTLVELMVAASIVLILTAAFMFNLNPLRLRAYRANAQGQGAAVVSALNAWARNNPASSLAAALQTSGLPAASYTDAPASMPNPANAVDCSVAGSLGGYSWPAAHPKVGCAAYADTSSGFEVPAVLTWVRGDTVYYLNGVTP